MNITGYKKKLQKMKLHKKNLEAERYSTYQIEDAISDCSSRIKEKRRKKK